MTHDTNQVRLRHALGGGTQRILHQASIHAIHAASGVNSVSGKRVSNPRPSAWEADALPLSYSRVGWRQTRFFEQILPHKTFLAWSRAAIVR